jgi:hypothetical protein
MYYIILFTFFAFIFRVVLTGVFGTLVKLSKKGKIKLKNAFF